MSLEGSDFRRGKPLLLLAYLVLEGPQERRHLAELFWPGSAQGMRNLATVLTRLRKTGDGVIDADGAMAWTTVDCDAKDLLALLENGQYPQAFELYEGPFVVGESPNWGSELEEWVYQVREFLAGRIREALLGMAEISAAQGAFDEAVRQAERAYLLAGAPSPEPKDLERLHLLFVAGGSHRAEQVRKEALDFDRALAVSAAEARDRLRSLQREEKRFGLSNLPERKTSFVGRELELSEVTELLVQPECRLITVVGMGGIGKTRLALQAATEQLQAGGFSDGVVFVPLEALTDAASIPAVVADALGLDLMGREDARSVVLRFLAEKRLLLLLDNFEHLLEGTSFVGELIDSCSTLKLLITSRERLNLESEWVFEVVGLAFPNDVATLERAAYFEAVQLFLQRARRTQRHFSLTPETLPAAIRICQLVDGMPLAIELASSWLRALPVREVATMLEASIDLLEIPTRDVSLRHRSVRVVFDHAWALLSEREKEVVRSLSVFRGGFSREAAVAVTGATLPLLARLVDKSLLHIGQDGRYDRHPLLSRYSKEKLAEHPDEHAEAEQQHGLYYLGFVRELEADLWTLKRKEAFRVFQVELANTRAAWDWAVAHQRVDEIEHTTPAMYDFFRVRFLEGLEHFGTTLEFFGGVAEHLDEANPSHLGALGTVLVHQVLDAGQMHRVPDFLWVRSLARRGIELLRSRGEPRGLARGFVALGESYYLMNEFAEARKCFQQALSIARKHGKSSDIFHALWVMDLLEKSTGAQYLRFVREALEEVRALDNLPGVSWFLRASGEFLVYDRRYAESRTLSREALRLARELGYHLVVIFSLLDLARASFELGEDGQAAAYSEEAHRVVEETGLTHFAPYTLAELGRVAIARGDFKGARDLLLRSLQEGWARKFHLQIVGALIRYAELSAAEGRPAEAVALLTLVLNERSTWESTKDAARSVLEGLRGSLKLDGFAAAVERARGMNLDEVVRDLTGEFVGSDPVGDNA